MEVKTCKRCGKLFQYVTGPAICTVCKQEEEKIFAEVKDYLRDNKGATIEEVSRATGASISLIERFLKQGRLEVMEGSPIEITCERCGKKIKTGKYCDQCKVKIAATLDIMAKDMRTNRDSEDVKARMRFLNTKKDK